MKIGKKRIVSLLMMIVCVLIACALAWLTSAARKDVAVGRSPRESDNIVLWYTDASLTDYLTNMAASYYEETGIHVAPVLQQEYEYLEAINSASIGTGQEDDILMPDIYLLTNDSLEKAYAAGLALDVSADTAVLNSENYPQTALSAVSYQDRFVGYPFSFETSALLYNKTYLDEAKMSVPATIDDILTFADTYDAPENVEGIFKWDVSDIFYNYYFIGNYMIVGGDAGDDPSQINIDNEKTRECLAVYQNLNQFFSIDTKEVTYDSVLQDFVDGKVVMTVATTDAISRLEQAKAEGIFTYDYGIAKMPDLSSALKGRSLSVTNTLVVNGYSLKALSAQRFAKFLSIDCAGELYAATGKIPAFQKADVGNPNVQGYIEEYKNSISMPKMLETSNFWVNLEIVFAKIWEGEDVETALKELSTQIQSQLDHS